MIESPTHGRGGEACRCAEIRRDGRRADWRGKRKMARLLEEGDPSRRCTRVPLLPIFSTGATDCKERSGPLCSDRQELLPSVSAPRARTRSRLTPAQKEERPERVLRMARGCKTQEAAVPCGYLDGRRVAAALLNGAFTFPSRLLPRSLGKRPQCCPSPHLLRKEGGGASPNSLDRIDIQSKCQSSSLLKTPPPPPLATTSRSAGGIVIGD